MTFPLVLALFMGAAAPVSLDQIKADPNPEHRARSAIEFAIATQKEAEKAYGNGDIDGVKANLGTVVAAMEMAQDSLTASHKTPGRNPGVYKFAELHSRELLVRMGDLEQRMNADERDLIAGARSKVQEIHDVWFDGIMSRKK